VKSGASFKPHAASALNETRTVPLMIEPQLLDPDDHKSASTWVWMSAASLTATGLGVRMAK